MGAKTTGLDGDTLGTSSRHFGARPGHLGTGTWGAVKWAQGNVGRRVARSTSTSGVLGEGDKKRGNSLLEHADELGGCKVTGTASWRRGRCSPRVTVLHASVA